jgi:predicted lipoprotein with Yx(FWY)xxD motif
MRATTLLTSAALLAVASYGIAVAADAMPAGVKAMGGMLEDGKGMTLYTWDNDKEANKSSCTGMCLMNWPAFKASATDKDMGDWKVITRDDGSKQWAYKGKPLYYFVMDTAAGDKKGEGRGMVWHMAHM